MQLNDYQKGAAKTAKYPAIGKRFVYPALGLAGEAGEVLENVKKIFRNDKGRLTAERKDLIKRELGDVLWYIAMLARDFGFSLEEVGALNLEKLKSRQKRGVLHSTGDKR